MSALGNRVLRKEDTRFLTGKGLYVENLPLEDALNVTFVRSPFAHARISGIDASAATDLPNVQVLTAADVDVGPFGPPPLPGLERGMARPLVAKDVVALRRRDRRDRRQPDRTSGVDAAELVMVDYDPLPVVASATEAVKDETPRSSPRSGRTSPAAAARPSTTRSSSTGATSSSRARSSASAWRRARSSRARRRRCAARTDGSPRGCRRRRRTRTGSGSPARSASSPTRSASSARDVGGGFGAKLLSVGGDPHRVAGAAASAAPSAGPRRGARAWSPSTTAARSSSTSRSAARATASCSPTSSDILAGRRRIPRARLRSCRT